MKISQHKYEDTLIFRLDGMLDHASVTKVSLFFDQADSDHRGNILLNMQKVKYIDSAGLGLLVLLQRQATQRSCQLSICELSDQALKLFELTRLTRVFTIYAKERDVTSSVVI